MLNRYWCATIAIVLLGWCGAVAAQDAAMPEHCLHHEFAEKGLPDDAGPAVNINGRGEKLVGCPPETTSFSVPSATGTSSFNINGSQDPELTLQRGHTYTFTIGTTGHPFNIKTERVIGTGSRFDDGVTNNGIESGTLADAFQMSFGATGRKERTPTASTAKEVVMT